MPNKCIYVSKEFADEAEVRGISWTEASRVGMAILLKENTCTNEIIERRKEELKNIKLTKLAEEYKKIQDGKVI